MPYTSLGSQMTAGFEYLSSRRLILIRATRFEQILRSC
jgi:hypothetical protein